MPIPCATRTTGVCKTSSVCVHCRPRTFGGAGDPGKVAWWAEDLNGTVTPFDVALLSDAEFSFRCSLCKHTFLKRVRNLASRGCPYCANQSRCPDPTCVLCTEHSFANCKFPLALQCWMEDKNGCTPREVALNCSKTSYWFKCSEPRCGHEWSTMLGTINKGKWCPYCANQERCPDPTCVLCTEHSFAGCKYPLALQCWMKDKNGCTPREVALNCCKTSYWFKCSVPRCGHEWEAMLGQINNGTWCPFCDNSRRCASPTCVLCTEHSFAGCKYPLALQCWMEDKNGCTPREVALNCCKNSYWFKCGQLKCGHQWRSMLSSISQGRWCPACTNKTERKLLTHLRSTHNPADITYQYRLTTLSRYPFDFYIISRRTVAETDGNQHFIQVSNWQSNDDTRSRDVVKMVAAATAGLHLVRLYQVDVFKDLNRWQDCLAATLVWLETQNVPTVVYMAFGTSMYDQHSIDLTFAAPQIRQMMMEADSSLRDAAEAVACRELAVMCERM